MSKRNVIRCVLTVLMLVYLVVALPAMWRETEHARFKNLQIEIIDPDNVGFVDQADVNRELGNLSSLITTKARSDVSTQQIEDKLNALDKVENAECIVLSDGTLKISVKPMRPVARVIDPRGITPSYYINREGKRILAELNYRIDVPMISGTFGSKIRPADIMPLIDYIDANPHISDLVSSISISPKGDIIVVPALSGHVINLGDTSILHNKWHRVLTFYHKVMPHKGWDYYDTISVKWRGQIVATLRHIPEPAPPVPLIDDGADEIDDVGTIATVPTEQKSE